jgi:AcrR family transcriptional regulator
MSLLEAQMSERRERILSVAKQLIAEGGFHGLTMRQLAERARVSVPTVYNLVGNKYLLLELLVREQLGGLAQRIVNLPQLSAFEYLRRAVDVAHDTLLENPSYTRALAQVFLTADDSAPARRALERQSIALISAALIEAQRLGEVVTWVDAELAARPMYAIYLSSLLSWAAGDLEEAELRTSTRVGMGLFLLAITQGETRRALEAAVRAEQVLVRGRGAEPEKGG